PPPTEGSRHFSGVRLTLRRCMAAPSAWNVMRPLLRSALLASLTFSPLIVSVTLSPLQTISYLFHSPSGFSTSLSVFMRNQWPLFFGSCSSALPSTLQPISQISPALPESSCASKQLGHGFVS